MGAVLISYSFRGGTQEPLSYSSYGTEQETIHTKGSPVDTQESAPTPVIEGEALFLKDIVLTLGESLDSLLAKLGTPRRIAPTEYDFEFYIYNENYSNLLFVAVKEKEIAGFYTDSLYFRFMGIKAGSDIEEVNLCLDSRYSLSEILTYDDNRFTASILMDKIGTGTVTGVYILSNEVVEGSINEDVMKSMALLTYDLTNSIRARNSLPLLSWSSSAAMAARKHSYDMAHRHYFDHVSYDGSLPADRLREAGVSFQKNGENIIAGYGTAILSSHAWFNSPGHRINLLNPDYISLGIGFVYLKDSDYGTYMTQDFYR